MRRRRRRRGGRRRRSQRCSVAAQREAPRDDRKIGAPRDQVVPTHPHVVRPIHKAVVVYPTDGHVVAAGLHIVLGLRVAQDGARGVA